MSEASIAIAALTLAWLAGFRVYLTVFALGLGAWLGLFELPPALAPCASPWVLIVAGLLTAIEFSADKIPGVDSIWDLLNTLVRLPAGALLAAGAAAGDGGEISGFWLGLGAGMALASHGLKTGTRIAINASPEPVSNWISSGSEDGAALGASLLVFQYPLLALALALLVPLGLAALLWWLLARLRRRPAADTSVT